MKDNVLVKILAVIFFGFILNTCILDNKKNITEIKKEKVKTDSLEKK